MGPSMISGLNSPRRRAEGGSRAEECRNDNQVGKVSRLPVRGPGTRGSRRWNTSCSLYKACIRWSPVFKPGWAALRT